MELINSSDYLDDNSNNKSEEDSDVISGQKLVQIAQIFYNIFQAVSDAYDVFKTLNYIELGDNALFKKMANPEYVFLYNTSNKILQPLYNIPFESWVDFSLIFAGEAPDVKPGFNITDPDHMVYITSFAATMGFYCRIGLIPKDFGNFNIVEDEGTYGFAATLNTPTLANLSDVINLEEPLENSSVYNISRLAVANALFILGNSLSPEQAEIAELTGGMDYYIKVSIVLSLYLSMFLYILGFFDPVRCKDIIGICKQQKPNSVIDYMAISDQLTVD